LPPPSPPLSGFGASDSFTSEGGWSHSVARQPAWKRDHGMLTAVTEALAGLVGASEGSVGGQRLTQKSGEQLASRRRRISTASSRFRAKTSAKIIELRKRRQR